jgi:hypothetical protein
MGPKVWFIRSRRNSFGGRPVNHSQTAGNGRARPAARAPEPLTVRMARMARYAWHPELSPSTACWGLGKLVCDEAHELSRPPAVTVIISVTRMHACGPLFFAVSGTGNSRRPTSIPHWVPPSALPLGHAGRPTMYTSVPRGARYGVSMSSCACQCPDSQHTNDPPLTIVLRSGCSWEGRSDYGRLTAYSALVIPTSNGPRWQARWLGSQGAQGSQGCAPKVAAVNVFSHISLPATAARTEDRDGAAPRLSRAPPCHAHARATPTADGGFP